MTLQHQPYQHQRYDAVTPAAYAMSEHKRHQHLKFICDVTLVPLRYQRHTHRRCDADMHLGNDSSTAKPSSSATCCEQQLHFIHHRPQQHLCGSSNLIFSFSNSVCEMTSAAASAPECSSSLLCFGVGSFSSASSSSDIMLHVSSTAAISPASATMTALRA